jgi:hypothetical protein
MDQTTYTTQKSRTHVFKFFTALTQSVEKNINLMGSSKFILCYLVNTDHNSMAAHLTRSDYDGSSSVDGNDNDMLWNDSEDGDSETDW